MPDYEALAASVVRAAREYVGRTVDGLQNRVAVLESALAKVSAVPAAKDGRDGLPGRDGAAGLAGKDGAPGRDGKDGLGFDDLSVEYDGERTVVLKFQRGAECKSFPLVLPIMIDRGVYKDGATYQRGDAVSWAGSSWIAQADTSGKPGMGEDWRLAVKRGRDGKDGAPPAEKPAPAVVRLR